MRNQLPADPFDRLVDLERQAELLDAELRAIRNGRQGRGTLPRPAFTVKTAEWFDNPGYSYPSGTANPQDLRLPIAVQSWELSGSGRPTYTDRSQYASHYAFSPIGWFPPGCVCQAYWNGAQFVIVDGPPMIHGRADSAITAATNETGYITPGSGNVEIYRYDETDLDPVKYADDAVVKLRVSNAGDAVSDNAVVRVFRDDKGEWWVKPSTSSQIWECWFENGASGQQFSNTTEYLELDDDGVIGSDSGAWEVDTTNHEIDCKVAGWWTVRLKIIVDMYSWPDPTDEWSTETVVRLYGLGQGVNGDDDYDTCYHLNTEDMRSFNTHSLTCMGCKNFAVDDVVYAKVRTSHPSGDFTLRVIDVRWIMHKA